MQRSTRCVNEGSERPIRERHCIRALGLSEVEREIDQLRPLVVVALGDVVTSVLLDDDEARVRELRGRTDLKWDGLPLIAGYHPLAARRRPNLYPLLVEDLKRARALGKPPESASPVMTQRGEQPFF